MNFWLPLKPTYSSPADLAGTPGARSIALKLMLKVESGGGSTTLSVALELAVSSVVSLVVFLLAFLVAFLAVLLVTLLVVLFLV